MAFLDETGLAEVWSLVTAEDAKNAKIALVSYTGTGNYGIDNPSSLTFDFAPKVVLLVGYKVGAIWRPLMSIASYERVMTAVVMQDVSTTYEVGAGLGAIHNSELYGKKSSDGKTLTWYSTNNATSQCNASVGYYFLALG